MSSSLLDHTGATLSTSVSGIATIGIENLHVWRFITNRTSTFTAPLDTGTWASQIFSHLSSISSLNTNTQLSFSWNSDSHNHQSHLIISLLSQFLSSNLVQTTHRVQTARVLVLKKHSNVHLEDKQEWRQWLKTLRTPRTHVILGQGN